MVPHYIYFVIWRFLLNTSVEAAYSPRHGLSEDHPVLLGGTSIFTMGVVIHTDLRNTHIMWTHKPTKTHTDTGPHKVLQYLQFFD